MQVRVWNDNVHVYRETWKDMKIEIPPKQFITMEFMDASDFLGTRPQRIDVDANGTQKPESYKMLRIEKMDGREAEARKEFRCMIDNQVFRTQAELDEYIAKHYAEKIVDEESKTEFAAKRRGRPKKGDVKDDSSGD